MKTKSKIIFGIFLISLLLVPILVSAASCPSGCTVNTFLKYEDNVSATSKTLTQGDTVNLVMVAYSHGEKLSLEKLEIGSTLILQENKEGVEQTTLSYLYNNIYTLNTAILIPGTYTLKFSATSLSGEKDYSTLEIKILKKIVVDTNSPVVNILSPTNGAIYTVNKTQMVATITEDNLKECWYDLGSENVSFSCNDGTNTINSIISKQGRRTWKVYAKDLSGNVGSDTVVFTVQSPADTTLPVVKIKDPINGATYSSQRTGLTFNVQEDNLRFCVYSLDGTHFSSVSSPTNGDNVVSGITSINGVNTWTVQCTDLEGNVGSDTITFTVNIPVIDTTAPIVKISDPINGAVYNYNKTQMVTIITEDHLAQCWYDLGSGNVSFSCVNGTNTINSIISKQGLNTWKVYAKDVAGNIGSDTVVFTVKNPTPGDTTLPIVKITDPVDGGIYTSNRTQMKVTVIEENLKECWYELVAGFVTPFSCVNGTNTINSIISKQGLNTWKVYAKDVAGNIGSDTVVFTVITSPTSPLEITPIVPTNGEIIKGNIIFKAIVNKFSNVTYSLDSGANVTMAESSSLTFISSSLSLSIGTHTVTFCAKTSTEVVCKPVTFEVKEDKTDDKIGCKSCSSRNNGPLNETIPENKKNYPGKVSTEEYIYLNLDEGNKLNIIQRILLWISNLFR